MDLNRDHKAGRALQQDEKVRLTKCGFVAKENRVVTGPQLEPNDPNEIVDGCPITRCIGDHRFKSNPKLGFDRQAIISLPEVKTLDEWKPMDWIVIGSTGFWELGGFNSKNTIENIKKVKFGEVLSKAVKARNLKRKRKEDYENGSEILKDLLQTLIEEGMSKTPPAGGVPKIDAKGLYAPGFNNMSAIIIRLKEGPTPWKDPALTRSSLKKSIDLKKPESKETSQDREQSSRLTAPADEVI